VPLAVRPLGGAVRAPGPLPHGAGGWRPDREAGLQPPPAAQPSTARGAGEGFRARPSTAPPPPGGPPPAKKATPMGQAASANAQLRRRLRGASYRSRCGPHCKATASRPQPLRSCVVPVPGFRGAGPEAVPMKAAPHATGGDARCSGGGWCRVDPARKAPPPMFERCLFARTGAGDGR
jgi:hypothetical protein